MYLIFDTETTTFPNNSFPDDHPLQCHIVQIAWLYLDENLNERSSFSSLIKPERFTEISPGAQEVHKITIEKCSAHGLPIAKVLDLFFDLQSKTKFSVAHNLEFDHRVVSIDSGKVFKRTSDICTMQAMTNICQLQGKYNKFKWPKLQEAHEFLFKEQFSKAHDALADVRACGKILRWLVENKKVG